MKAHAVPSQAALPLWLALLILAGSGGSAQGAYYQVGQIVTNFLVYARPSLASSGEFAENAPMRLQDFAGKIVFVEFFDPT